MKKVRIIITLKDSVLDTQGKAIEDSLNNNLGYNQIKDVRQGKVIEMKISDDQESRIVETIDQICDKILVNSVIEKYSYQIID